MFLAILANAIDLERVAAGQVMMLASNLPFDLADLRRKELDGRAAFGANHMVMAAAVVLVLITRDAIVKGDLARESASGEQF
jgi:hypothetical protein